MLYLINACVWRILCLEKKNPCNRVLEDDVSRSSYSLMTSGSFDFPFFLLHNDFLYSEPGEFCVI